LLKTFNELREQEDKAGVITVAQRRGHSLANGFNLSAA
jgi:hypothetical protein